MSKKISIPKKLIALILACLLIVGTLPALALELAPVVVDPTSTAEDGTTTDAKTGYLVYKTISAAINSFGGEEGKVYLKGTLTAAGSAIEGTTADRAKITIAGYDDVATGGTLTATGVSQGWLKGDLTFENITVGTSGDNGFNSNGHQLTFGTGIVSTGTLNVGGQYSTNGNYVEFNSGTYNTIAARLDWNNSPNTAGTTHYVINSGATVNNIFAGINQNNGSGTVNMTNDYVLDINGGTFKYLYLGSMCYNAAVANKADTIININRLDRSPTNGIVFGHTNQTAYTKASPLALNKFGNIAVVIDCAGMPGTLYAYNRYWPGYTLIPDEGKYFMIIANNYDPTKFEITKYTEEAYNINSLDYIIYTLDGVTQPVFEDTVAGDDTSSVLKGFTITANAGDSYVPAVNGTKLTAIGTTADGKAIYDLSAYKGTRTAKTITNDSGSTTDTHITDTEPVTISFLDTSVPIVSTDDTFTAPTGYKKVATIAEAITQLGSDGGTIYIHGAYEVGTDVVTAFANTANIADGKGITILGWADDNTVATDNSISFGYAWSTAVNSAWLHCDLTIDNITVIQSNTSEAGFYSNGNTITFGSNVVSTGLTIGYRDSILTASSNNIVINGGNFAGVYNILGWYGDGTYNADTNITFNGGTVSDILYVLGKTDASGTRVINGDINYTVNGGNYGGISLGGAGGQGGKNTTVNGDVTIRVNGGTLTNALTGYYLGTSASSKYNGNISLIIDYSKVANNINEIANDNIQTSLANGKKAIIIANNLESVATSTFSGHITNKRFNYAIEVANGAAEPVFDETTGNLKGFTLTTDLGEEYVPTINGTKLTAIGTTADGKAIYDLSAYENDCANVETAEVVTIEVTFQASMKKFINYRNPLSNVTEKLKNNEDINVVYFGGSVTNGGNGCTSGKAWRELTSAYLTDYARSINYTGTLTNINRAVGESGTFLGAYRVPRDIITANPDLIFIEYSINDGYFNSSYDQAKSQFETIIREIKTALPNCDIVTVLVTDRGHVLNARDGILHKQAQAHEDVAAAYNIPSLHVGRAVASLMPAGDLTDAEVANFWSIYAGDWSHPTDAGHAVYYSVVQEFLENELAGANTNTAVAMPQEIVSVNLFDGNRTIIDGEKAIVVENSGKTPVENTSVKLDNFKGGDFTYESADYTLGYATYPGYLSLAAGKTGSVTVQFTGTEFAFFADIASSSAITYSVQRSDGTYLYENATYTVPGHRPYKVFENVKEDTYTVTLTFDNTAGTDEIKMPMVMHRNAAKQTGEYNYGKYWVKSGGTGKGLSPNAPAKSVAWLINNVIADAHTADETIEIYIMQDDAEILYNSTAYVTDDESYVAPEIGNDKGTHKLAEHKIGSWTSSSDGTAKAHTATIVIKSYADGNSETNYLAFNHNLGSNAVLNLQGPTVFDNINTVSMRYGYTGIYANGHDMEFTANYASYNVQVGEYEALKQWDGTFVKQTDAASTATGSSYANPSYSGNGGRVVYNQVYDRYGGIIIGTIGNANTVYSGDTVVVLNNPLVVDTYSNEGTTITVANSTTTFGTISLLLNYEGVVNVKGATSTTTGLYNATVTKGLQLIRNLKNAARWPHIPDRAGNIPQNTFSAIAAQNNVPFWDVQFVGDTPYLDVYEENGEVVLGKYNVTTVGTVIAFNKYTEKFIYSVDGVLDLTGLEGGSFLVYLADDATNGILEIGDTYFATEDTTVTITDLAVCAYEGKAFIGWQKDGAFVKGATVALRAGETLEAVYMDYDSDANGDFYIEGIQMRVDSTDSIRFVVTMKNSILNKLSAAGATLITDEVAYGSLVLPTELTYGMDLVYGQAIVDRNGKTLGTPTIVPAEKIYADVLESGVKTGVQYTVAVTGVTGNKQIRSYSVQGYIRYIDANGNEQVLYSGYGQSSLYRVALRIAADETASDSNRTAANTVVTNVKNTVQQSYLNYVYSNTTTVNNVLGLTNLTITNLANGFQVSDFNIDWNYNADVADTVNTEVLQITDTHLIYNNRVDNSIKNPSILSAGIVRGNSFLNGEENAVRAMQFAMTGNKTIITGDVFDYLSEGCAQKVQRLFFGYDVNYLGKFGTVGATLGNHEATRAFGKFPDTGANVNNGTNYEWIQNNWVDGDNSIYEMEIVYNDNGKNPVMTISLHSGTNDYSMITDELYAQFKADLQAARNANIPVLIFQHIPIAVDGNAMKHVTDSTKNDMTFFAATSKSSGRTGEMYKTITDNADIIKGIFCGHEHDYFYGTITGTDQNATKIPQISFMPNMSGKGYALRINVQ